MFFELRQFSANADFSQPRDTDGKFPFYLQIESLSETHFIVQVLKTVSPCVDAHLPAEGF